MSAVRRRVRVRRSCSVRRVGGDTCTGSGTVGRVRWLAVSVLFFGLCLCLSGICAVLWNGTCVIPVGRHARCRALCMHRADYVLTTCRLCGGSAVASGTKWRAGLTESDYWYKVGLRVLEHRRTLAARERHARERHDDAEGYVCPPRGGGAVTIERGAAYGIQHAPRRHPRCRRTKRRIRGGQPTVHLLAVRSARTRLRQFAHTEPAILRRI